MNYLNVYNNLVESRKLMNRTKRQDTYYESHHIIPKWLGGSNSASNRVLLTPREHFIAHRCLWKHYRDRPSALALHKMAKSNTSKQKRSFTSREFEIARKAFSESQKGEKNHMYGKPSPNRGKTNISKGKKLNPRPWLQGDNNPSRRSDVRTTISQKLTGKSKSKQHVEKMRDLFFASSKIKCVHCEKEVDYRNFGRWHGEKCKKYTIGLEDRIKHYNHALHVLGVH